MAVYNPGVKRTGPTFNLPHPSTSSGDGGGVGLGKIAVAPFKFQANLFKDVAQAGMGFFPGMAKLIKDPIETSKAIGKGMWHDWSPLFHGDVKTFAKQTYEHPLGPLLDVAAIFTLGGAAVARGAGTVGRAGAKAGMAPATVEKLQAVGRPSTIYRKDRPGTPGRSKRVGQVPREAIPRSTSPNPVTRWRMEHFHNLSENLAMKGGRWGIPAQLSYEHAQLARLAGNVGAIGFQFGKLSNFLRRAEQAKTNPQKRVDMLREFFEGNYENAIRHSEGQNLFIPLERALKEDYNRVSYDVLRKRNLVMAKPAVYAGTDEAILHNFRTLGNRLMTRGKNAGKDAQIFMRDGVPHVALLHKQSARAMGIEATNTTNFIMKSMNEGTMWWKAALLGYAPRFWVNNAVGNSMMYLMENAGASAAIGLYESFRQLKGIDKADKWLAEGIKDSGALRNDHWVNRWHSDQLAHGFHMSAIPIDEAGAKFAGITELMGDVKPRKNLFFRGAGKMFARVGKDTERFLRVASIHAKVRSEPLIKAEISRLKPFAKNWGWNRTKILDQAVENVYKRNPEVRRRVTQEVESTMGNYLALHNWERKFRAVDPFYTWQRHITFNSARLAMNRPGRTTLATDVGMEGSTWINEALGDEIPDWMRAFIPLGEKGNRYRILNTQGANPWAQVAELAEVGESVLPGGGKGAPRLGETLGSLLNPFVQAGVQELSGTSLLSGMPISKQSYGPVDDFRLAIGPLGRMLASPAIQLPQFTLAQSLAAPNQYKEPTLYSKSSMEYFLALMGVPAKDVYPKRARQLGRQEIARRGG